MPPYLTEPATADVNNALQLCAALLLDADLTPNDITQVAAIRNRLESAIEKIEDVKREAARQGLGTSLRSPGHLRALIRMRL